MKILLLVSLFFLSIVSSAQQSLQLLFIGDIMGHDTQLASAYNDSTKQYNFDSCFQYISPIIKSHDYAIANLEVTLNCKPYSGYPAFSSPASLADEMYTSGVDCFVTANNHSADRGKKGVLQTIKALDSIGVAHTGTFATKSSREKQYPLIIEKHGIRVALLNYTYGLNGIPVPEGTVINLIDTIQIAKDLQKAKKFNIDKTIVFIHWGTEYELEPNQLQIQTANAILRAGADIIIGSHPHVVQRAEFNETKQQFVVYSMGNFISNQRTQPRDGGMMIHIELQKKDSKVRISNVGYILTWVYTPIKEGKRKFYVLPASEYLQNKDFFKSDNSYEIMENCINQIKPILEKGNLNVHEMHVK